MLSLDVDDLPSGWTPLRSVTVVEALQEDGTVGLCLRCTRETPAWALLGMLDAAHATLTDDVVAGFIEETDDPYGYPSEG